MVSIRKLDSSPRSQTTAADRRPSAPQARQVVAGMPSRSHAQLLGAVPKNGIRKEAIDWTNDPGRFSIPLDTKLTGMKMSGAAKQRPWADTYWPTYQDGLNHRWQSTGDFKKDLSPAEKYDAAFNGWNPDTVQGLKPFVATWGSFDKPFDQAYYDKLGPLAKYLSNYAGNQATRAASAAGKLNTDGTAKSGKKEEDYGGLETWHGLCHAWSPAAIREKEPLHAVEMNGIRFEVSDIKALLIGAYNRANSIMIGGRDEDNKIELDDKGRPKKEDARDINPGTFHILLANLLGRDGQSFIEDRTGNYQVWNQPIASYKVQSQTEVTAAQAAQLVGDTSGKYPFNDKAKKFFHVKTEVDYISESQPSTTPNADTSNQQRQDPYEYILELDDAGKVIGGEWLGSSRTEHPDFLWYPYKDGGTPIAPQLDYAKVKQLLELSRAPAGGTAGGGTANLVNVEASVALKAGKTKALDPITVTKDGVLEFMLAGSGDMDVYAAIGHAPTFNDKGEPLVVNLSLYEPGSSERKTLNVKKNDVVNVIMRGYDDKANAKLTIKQL